MGIEQITEKILFDANEAARREHVKAKYHSREFERKARCLGDDLREDAEKRAAADTAAVKERRKSVAELEARKMRLSVKQNAVTKCFETAIERIAAMPSDDYVEFLAKTVCELLASEEEAGGELLLNARDREAIGGKLIQKVKDLNTKGEVVLSQETIDAKGGFVLRSGNTFLNSTLETMVGAVKEELTPEVVRTLFG